MDILPLQKNYTFIYESLAIIIVLYSLSLLFKKPKNTTDVPQASGGWPIIGHFTLFIGSSDLPHVALASLADQYGPMFIVRLGVRRVLVVSNWEISKEIFTVHDAFVSNRPKHLAAKVLGHNYASVSYVPYGPYWREIRKIISLELMSSSRLQKLKGVRMLELDNAIKSIYELWREKKDGKGKILVEMNKWFWELNMNIVLRMVVGKRYTGAVDDYEDEDEMKRRRELMREWFHYLGMYVVGDTLPFLGWLDLGGHEKSMKRIASGLDSMFGKILDEHRRKRASADETESEKYFIDMLMSVVKHDGLEGFDADTIIKSTCMTLIVSSSDTTTVMLNWTLSLLLNNPGALKKAQEELDLHVGDRQVTESDIKDLVYLQAVVKETLRLYPAAFLGGPRVISEDCTIAGYHVPKGTWLLINMWKLHRDPNIWSDPCEFRPERFLTPDHKDVEVNGTDFELIPFGAGRRSCPGMGLALQILHMVLATLLQKFELSTPNGAQVDMTESAGMTNDKATPLEVLVAPRFRKEKSQVSY